MYDKYNHFDKLGQKVREMWIFEKLGTKPRSKTMTWHLLQIYKERDKEI